MDLGVCSFSRKVCVLGPVSYRSCGHGDTYNPFWGKDQPQMMGKDIRWGLKCVLDGKMWCRTIRLAAGVAELWHCWESKVSGLPGLEILTLHFLPLQPYDFDQLLCQYHVGFLCKCLSAHVYMFLCKKVHEFKSTYICLPVEWRSQPQVVELCRHPQVSEIGSCTRFCTSLTQLREFTGVSRGSSIFVSPMLGLKVPVTMSSSLYWCWRLDLDPYTCKADTLSTVPFSICMWDTWGHV